MVLIRRSLFLVLFVGLIVSMLPTAVFAADDWDVSGGHFFTQAGGGNGKGYTVVDDSNAKFWSEFQRLGGVAAVGYPASRRFSWDGFTVQVFQRVIFQWHADTGAVTFVNTFDRLHDLGKDDWLLSTKQTPKPTTFDEQGKSWDQIVAGRLATLEQQPAIKAKYYAVTGDPIQANGLPTSTVTDEGNHLALRAQRVEFQLWKQDVPWAKAGTVTVALGGDTAKEAGILPDQAALQPGTPDDIANGATIPGIQWATHTDGEKSFNYPADWLAGTSGGLNGYFPKDGNALFLYAAPFNMGANFNQSDFITNFAKAVANDTGFQLTTRQSATINGYPADLQYFDTTNWSGEIATIQNGGRLHLVWVQWRKSDAATYQPILTAMILSYVPHGG